MFIILFHKQKKIIFIFCWFIGASIVLNQFFFPSPNDYSSIDKNTDYLRKPNVTLTIKEASLPIEKMTSTSNNNSEHTESLAWMIDTAKRYDIDADSTSLMILWLVITGLFLYMLYRKMNKKTSSTTYLQQPFQLPSGINKVSQLPHDQRMELAIQGPTLVFDGVCHLCNGSMKWFSSRCPTQVWYMWCQHNDSQTLLRDYGITQQDLLQSWAFLENGVVFRGSTAWLRAVKHLNRPWCYMSYLEYIFPLWIRETVYGFIATNRYKIFGKSDACERPNKEMISRMLHSLRIQEEEQEETTTTQDKQRKSLIIPKPVKKRLLIVGCGPAGILVAKNCKSKYDVLVVEPKDFYEFTPGILRGMCDPVELKKLQCPLRPIIVDQLGISLIQGVVTKLTSHSATIKCISLPEQQEEMDKLNRFLVSNTTENGSTDTSIRKIEFDYCVIACGSEYNTSSLWKVSPYPNISHSALRAASDKDKINGKSCPPFTQSSRVAQMIAEHERLQELNANGSYNCSITIVGAGLVGVELAAEICIYYPNISQCITLYDLAPTILPSFPQRAVQYATEWLTNHGVAIATDATLEEIEKAKKESNVVYSCVGIKSTAENFMPKSTIGERGEIVVNAAMQVIQMRQPTPSGSSESGFSKNMSDTNMLDLFGSGRIFAVGDCIRVQGLPAFTKDTYPAEAMASIAMKNLKRSLNSHCTQNLHTEDHLKVIHPLQQITLCSLGPHDCMLIINGIYVANGKLATFIKETIQYTKMSEARNDFLGTALWSLIPHI